MTQMVLLTLLIVFDTCYGTSRNLKIDLDVAWSEWSYHLSDDYTQYIGYYEGMTDDIDIHSKIKAQYLSGINNIRHWHSVEPLKQIIELDEIAQAYANYIAKTGKYEVGVPNSAIQLIISCRDVNEDVGKTLPYELYSNFDKGDKPFDFEANEEEMVKMQNVEGRRVSTCIIWKSSINIGIGVAKTNEIICNKNTQRGPFYIIVAAIHPRPSVLEKFKENITPRNLVPMIHDGYFQNLEKEKERDKSFIRYKMDSLFRNLMERVLEKDVSIEKKEN
ncbi:uncharacterized protein LOC126902749 [Daktulosphaira vitifoliae]|uniref:uncharacterized protein LOC126902749 n=1 Tax=Daktulosphaira vitifoliae TaxID=58002 RepID=UPI0021AA5A72|nr:uncharacterized protein LOC126902749 [Daktulosphaira vitifoliae]